MSFSYLGDSEKWQISSIRRQKIVKFYVTHIFAKNGKMKRERERILKFWITANCNERPPMIYTHCSTHCLTHAYGMYACVRHYNKQVSWTVRMNHWRYFIAICWNSELYFQLGKLTISGSDCLKTLLCCVYECAASRQVERMNPLAEITL